MAVCPYQTLPHRASTSSEIDLKIQSSSQHGALAVNLGKEFEQDFLHIICCNSLCCTLTIPKRFSLRSGIFPKEVGGTDDFKGLKIQGDAIHQTARHDLPPPLSKELPTNSDLRWPVWLTNGPAVMALKPTPDCYFMFISFCYLFRLQPVFVPSIHIKARLNKLTKLNHPSINAAKS